MQRLTPRMEVLEFRRLFSGTPGFPDTTFGSGGEASAQAPGVPGKVIDAIAATDGSFFYLTETESVDSVSPRQFDRLPSALAVTKLTAQGQIDTSWGSSGRFTFTAQASVGGGAGIRILGDGSIIGGGVITSDFQLATRDIVLFRINPQGQADTAFGTGGFRSYDAGIALGGASRPVEALLDLEITSGGSIVFLSRDGAGAHTIFRADAATGALDGTFAVGGAVDALAGLPAGAEVRAFDLDASDRFYFNYFNNSTQAEGLVRRLPDSTLDTLFGTGGTLIRTQQRGIGQLRETTLGLFYAYPYSLSSGAPDGLRVEKLIPADGGIDINFGTSGEVSLSFTDATSIRIHPRLDNKVIVSSRDMGTSTTSVLLAKFDAAGQVSTYGSGGTVNVPIEGDLEGFALDVRPDDRFVLTSSKNGQQGLPREVRAFDASGSADATFNAGGSIPGSLLVRENGGGAAESQSIVRLANGTILSLDAQFDGSGVFTAYLTRISAAGAVQGSTLLTPQGTSGTFSPKTMKLLPQSDSTILVALGGSNPGEIGFVRLTANGDIDSTFGTNGFLAVSVPSAVASQPFENMVFALDPASPGVFISAETTAGSVIVRVNLSGTPEGFGTQSFVSFPQDVIYSLTATPGGGVTAVGFRPRSGASDLVLQVLDGNGNPVGGFNGGAPLVSTLGAAGNRFTDPQTVVRFSNGKIAVGGTVAEVISGSLEFRFFMLLLESDGTPSAGFGIAGVALSPVADVRGSCLYDIAEDPAGGYLVAGEHRGAALFARINPDGSLDTDYGENISANSPNHYDRFVSLTRDETGRPLAGGWISRPGESQRTARVVRFNGSQIPNPPNVAFVTPPNPNAGATQIPFSIVITPFAGRSVTTTSIDSSDITVTLPGGGSGVVVFNNFTGDPAVSVEAFYTLTAPGGGLVDGQYAFNLAVNAISDSFGAQTPSQLLGSPVFTFGSATLSVTSVVVPAPQVSPGGSIPVSFTVSNTGDVASLATTATVNLVSFDSFTLTLRTTNVAPIAPGGNLTIDLTDLIVPQGLLDGEYTVRVIVGTDARSSGTFLVLAPPPVVGGLDTTFGGGDGVAVTVVPGPAVTTTASIAVSGGRLVSVGFNTQGDATVVRTLPDGTPDINFGTVGDGRLVVDLRGTFDVATAVVVDGQGRLLVTGYSLDPAGGGATPFVFRVNDNGTLDGSFGNGGAVLLAPGDLAGTIATPRFAQLDPLGRLLVVGGFRQVGSADSDVRAFVLRVAPDGSADGSFGSGGVAIPAVSAGGGAVSFSVALLQADGKLLLGGSAAEGPGLPQRFLVTRLDSTGALDLRFGKKGVLLVPAAGSSQDRVTTLVPVPSNLKPKGAIYVGGVRTTDGGASSQAVVFRMTARGAVDRGFSRGLAILQSPGATVSTVTGIVVQAEGRVLISLSTANSAASFQAGRFGVTLVRLDAKGNADPFFNRGQPLIVSAIPAEPSAAQPVGASFDDFAQSKQGQATAVEGGAVRSIATRPTLGGTELRVAGIVPDGIDLASTLVASRLPATVAPGFRTSAQLSISNAGSLGSAGAFSITLVARPVGGGNEVVLRTVSQRRAIKAGATARINLPVALAKTFTPGEYTLLARVEPTFAELSRANNNATRAPGFTVAVPPGRSSFSINPIGLRPGVLTGDGEGEGDNGLLF
jgi:uncharacterized delta-60 repeat protein